MSMCEVGSLLYGISHNDSLTCFIKIMTVINKNIFEIVLKPHIFSFFFIIVFTCLQGDRV